MRMPIAALARGAAALALAVSAVLGAGVCAPEVAHADAAKYMLYYNDTGVSDYKGPKSEEKVAGSTVTVPDAQPSSEMGDLTFLGYMMGTGAPGTDSWTHKDANGVVTTDVLTTETAYAKIKSSLLTKGMKFTMPSKVTYLYARWGKNPTVTFDDGCGNTRQVMCPFGGTPVVGWRPVRAGYTFAGWSNFTSTTKFYSDATVKAKWTTDVAQFSYKTGDAVRGSVSVASESVSATSAPSGSTATAKAGYHFVAWTDESGAIVSTSAKLVPSKALSGAYVSQTYTAVFAADTDTKYTVNHHKQKADGTYGAADESFIAYGETGRQTSAHEQSYEGFVSQGVTQKTIAADGSTVVDIYYRRLVGTLAIAKTDADALDIVSLDDDISHQPEGNASFAGTQFTVTNRSGHAVSCNGHEVADGAVVATVTADAHGTAKLETLSWGTYEVAESKAPVGYTLNTRAYTVDVHGTTQLALK